MKVMTPDQFQTISLTAALGSLEANKRFREYRQLWARAGAYLTLTDYPMHLDIELSGLCNLRCEHCFQNGLITGDLGFMDWEVYRNIIDEGAAKGLCAVKLQVRGESMLHPKFFQAVRYAKQAGIMDVQLTTNATLLNRKTIDETLDSGLDGIIFSVDAHHGSSYAERYRKDQYSAVEKTIQQFLCRRRKRHSTKPWVRLQTAVPELTQDILDETKSRLHGRFPGADIIAVNRLQDFGEETDVYPDLQTHYAINPCNYLMHRLTIFWNGDVTLCCVDYNNRFQLGSVLHQSIQDIWHSKKMMRFRQIHMDGKRDRMDLCRHCHSCSQPKDESTVIDAVSRHIAEYGSKKLNPTKYTNSSKRGNI